MIHTNQNIYYSLYAIKHSLSLSVIAALLTKRLTRRMTDMVSSNDMGASFFKFHFELWKYARFVGSTCFLSSVSLFEPTQRFFSLLLFLCKRKPLFAKKTNKQNKQTLSTMLSFLLRVCTTLFLPPSASSSSSLCCSVAASTLDTVFKQEDDCTEEEPCPVRLIFRRVIRARRPTVGASPPLPVVTSPSSLVEEDAEEVDDPMPAADRLVFRRLLVHRRRIVRARRPKIHVDNNERNNYKKTLESGDTNGIYNASLPADWVPSGLIVVRRIVRAKRPILMTPAMTTTDHSLSPCSSCSSSLIDNSCGNPMMESDTGDFVVCDDSSDSGACVDSMDADVVDMLDVADSQTPFVASDACCLANKKPQPTRLPWQRLCPCANP